MIMKAIILLSGLVFVPLIAFGEEKVKIKLGKENIHGSPRKPNLCNPVDFRVDIKTLK